MLFWRSSSVDKAKAALPEKDVFSILDEAPEDYVRYWGLGFTLFDLAVALGLIVLVYWT